jgi:hypothetical protein
MADTGENRQITVRANARETETVRATKKLVSEERSSTIANQAAFGRFVNVARGRAAGSNGRRFGTRGRG